VFLVSLLSASSTLHWYHWHSGQRQRTWVRECIRAHAPTGPLWQDMSLRLFFSFSLSLSFSPRLFSSPPPPPLPFPFPFSPRSTQPRASCRPHSLVGSVGSLVRTGLWFSSPRSLGFGFTVLSLRAVTGGLRSPFFRRGDVVRRTALVMRLVGFCGWGGLVGEGGWCRVWGWSVGWLRACVLACLASATFPLFFSLLACLSSVVGWVGLGCCWCLVLGGGCVLSPIYLGGVYSSVCPSVRLPG